MLYFLFRLISCMFPWKTRKFPSDPKLLSGSVYIYIYIYRKQTHEKFIVKFIKSKKFIELKFMEKFRLFHPERPLVS